MNIHYFQRYNLKENVATSNTLLLVSRLYNYSTDKFHEFIREISNNSFIDFNTNVEFLMQVKSTKSVPDGQIKQDSFNIVIETKLGKWFDVNQIRDHLETFKNETYQIMLTLSPQNMNNSQVEQISEEVKKKNDATKQNIRHIHTTFENVISIMIDILDNYKDYKFIEMLDDYREFCSQTDLLSNDDKIIRVVPVGMTLNENIMYNLYHDPAKRGYTKHTYIALYKDKCIRYIGKINCIIEADIIDGKVVVKNKVNITKEQEENIIKANENAKKLGWNIEQGEKYFCVERFYETNYRKTSKNPLQGTKLIDITEFKIDEKTATAEQLADFFKDKEW